MSGISFSSRLSFFKAVKYEYAEYIFDASCTPRPHFCIGLLLEGTADFRDSTGSGEHFTLRPGEIVFVPVGTRYISHWKGSPKVSYISLHFAFEYPGIFTRQRNFKLQKFVPEDRDKMLSDFRYILEKQTGNESEQLTTLSKIFDCLSTILPHLESGNEKQIDSGITKVVDYIENNYKQSITVEKLAAVCNMSSSRFFPNFKKALGVTPVDYLNHYRINRAIALLVNEDDMTIENISSAVGFESSTYFRRVFKKITGKTPKEYRKISAEI